MKEEIILDLANFHLQEMICELAHMTTDEFINTCVRCYGEQVKSALSNIALCDDDFFVKQVTD